MNVFRADSNKGSFIGETAKEAAIGFFNKFPTARKCDIREGTYEDGFFTLAISRNSTNFRMNDVTKKMIDSL